MNREVGRSGEEQAGRAPFEDALTGLVIGCAMEVHRHLGPGLLESVYESCLCQELAERNLSFVRQVSLPIMYKSTRIDGAYRMDIVIADRVVVEVKAVETLLPIHEAQILTYMQLSGFPLGLLLNFHTTMLRHGIRRLSLKSSPPA